MRITDYPSVDSLTDNDVILIDGNNGTKKLLGSYIKSTRDALERYENPANGIISILESSIDSVTESGRRWVNSATYGGPEASWGLLENYESSAHLLQKWTKLTSGSTYIRYGLSGSGSWSEWYRVDSGEDLFLTGWVTNTSYAAGNVRRYKNATYICKLAHTSSDQLLPTNTTYWDKKNTGTIIQDMKTSFQAGVDTVYNACVNKGQTPSSSTPSAIASAIAALVKPSGTKSITSNGTHDVSAYASASVSVPSTVYHNGDVILDGSRTRTNTSRWYKYVALYYTSGYNCGGTQIQNTGSLRVYRDVPANSVVSGTYAIGIY